MSLWNRCRLPLIASGLLLTGCAESAVPTVPARPTVDGTTPVVFLDQASAAAFLGTEDAYLRRLNPYNRQLRMGTAKPVQSRDYAKFAAAQALEWTPQEKQRLRRLLARYAQTLAAYGLDWPEEVRLIKTTGKEDFEAAYTRGNAIILPQKIVALPDTPLESLLLHELFHILSRAADDAWRDRLYAVVGFQPTSRALPLPYPFLALAKPEELSILFKRHDIRLPHPLSNNALVNPDAFHYRYVIPVTLGLRNLYGLPVIFSREEDPVAAAEMGFHNILGFRLLLVAPDSAGRWRLDPRQRGQNFVHPRDVDGFWQQVGRNTEYIIHPEEILADNFSLLIQGKRDVPSPEILDRLDAALRAGNTEP